MRKIQVKAERTLLGLPNGQWYVHSIFKHTFNMTDRKHMPLILIATNQKKLLPGGIYLPEKDFYDLLNQIKDTKEITYSDQSIFIETAVERWQLVLSKAYDIRLLKSGIIDRRVALFLDACQKLDKLTGLDIQFHDLLSKNHSPLKDQIFQLMNPNTAQEAVRYFIGRGRGLTPSGDDFLIGWLLINWLTSQEDYLNDLIRPKIIDDNFTTDISRHYLNHAIHKRFSSALLDIAGYLDGQGADKDIDNFLQNAIDYGNTSGIDTISGVVSALIFNHVTDQAEV